MTGPPCIVCGAPRSPIRGIIKHVAEIHEEYNREYRRWANLLRPRCPQLKGLGPLLEHYGEDVGPKRSTVKWGCKVLKSGEVVHGRIADVD